MIKTIDSSLKKQLDEIIFYLFLRILFTKIKYLFFLHINNVQEILIVKNIRESLTSKIKSIIKKLKIEIERFINFLQMFKKLISLYIISDLRKS
jgi:hypothetical protein